MFNTDQGIMEYWGKKKANKHAIIPMFLFRTTIKEYNNHQRRWISDLY